MAYILPPIWTHFWQMKPLVWSPIPQKTLFCLPSTLNIPGVDSISENRQPEEMGNTMCRICNAFLYFFLKTIESFSTELQKQHNENEWTCYAMSIYFWFQWAFTIRKFKIYCGFLFLGNIHPIIVTKWRAIVTDTAYNEQICHLKLLIVWGKKIKRFPKQFSPIILCRCYLMLGFCFIKSMKQCTPSINQ